MTLPHNFYYPYSDRMDEPDVRRALELGWKPSNGRHCTIAKPGGRWQTRGCTQIVEQQADGSWTAYDLAFDTRGMSHNAGHATFMIAIEWCIAQRAQPTAGRWFGLAAVAAGIKALRGVRRGKDIDED